MSFPPVISQLDISIPELPATDADAALLAQNIARVASAYPTLVPEQLFPLSVLHFHAKSGLIQQTVEPYLAVDGNAQKITIDVGIDQTPSVTITTTEADKPCGRLRTTELLALAQRVSGMFGNTMVNVPEAGLFAIQGVKKPDNSQPTDPFAVQQATRLVSSLRNAEGHLILGYN